MAVCPCGISQYMRSTPGLDIGVFNFGDLGRSRGMGRYKLPKNCAESLPNYRYFRL